MSLGKQETPKAPDYKGAAEATASGQRVNQYTPWGSSTYAETGRDSSGNPIYSQTVNLSPEQQQLLTQQNQLSLGLGGAQNNALGYVNQALSNPLDASRLPAEQINAGQTVQDALMARLTPQFERKQSQLETQLANQGLARGSEAWNNATGDLAQQRTDAELQAALQGMQTGQQARQQALQEQSFLQSQPINTLNALRSGSQVTAPQFGPTAGGANYSQAAQNQYNANLGAANANNANSANTMNGLFSLGSLFFSDRRLKTNIKHIGHTLGGVNVYSYDYVWGEPSIGVMADEVKHIPGAVVKHTSGFDMVDYSKVK